MPFGAVHRLRGRLGEIDDGEPAMREPDAASSGDVQMPSPSGPRCAISRSSGSSAAARVADRRPIERNNARDPAHRRFSSLFGRD